MQLQLLPSADGRDDVNFRILVNMSGQAAGVTHVLSAHKNINVLSNLSLLGEDTVADPGIEVAERRQGLRESSSGEVD